MNSGILKWPMILGKLSVELPNREKLKTEHVINYNA